jgi:hypothetical protein
MGYKREEALATFISTARALPEDECEEGLADTEWAFP